MSDEVDVLSENAPEWFSKVNKDLSSYFREVSKLRGQAAAEEWAKVFSSGNCPTDDSVCREQIRKEWYRVICCICTDLKSDDSLESDDEKYEKVPKAPPVPPELAYIRLK